ncbi:hypothetical protein F5Y16DRAFT_408709 [Xylariaceae sp. FL0255]|nr:hypothetical protein F5Y16DRAFT_408709 [Xylariaceae sp. FL0255]
MLCNTFFAALLLLLAPATNAAAVGSSQRENLHTQYVDDSGKVVMQLLVENYTGSVNTVSQDLTEFIPTVIFATTTDLIVREIDPCDICVYLRECAVKNAVIATPSKCTALANSMKNYFTENNYEHAKAILDGSISSLAWAIPLSAATYYFNAQLGQTSNAGSNDACGDNNPSFIAGTAGSAMLEFCQELQKEALSDVSNRFIKGDAKDGEQYPPNGKTFAAKFYIDDKKFTTSEVCKDYGIVWKRDLNAAVKRGASRMITF